MEGLDPDGNSDTINLETSRLDEWEQFMEMNPKDKSFPSIREFLAQGEIPLGQLTLPANVNRENVLKLLADHFKGIPKEWSAENHRWSKDNLLINILWYPEQPVFFTFRDGDLVLIEFSGLTETGSRWDYSFESQKYFRIKKDVVNHLGVESRSNESDVQNMEAVWEFAKLTFYVACDARTGGCGIGLRAKL